MKRILWGLGGVVLIALVYYVFIKSSEFEVNFKARTLPGDLIQTIRIWNRSLEQAKIVRVDSFNSLKQEIQWNDRRYIYDWHFSMLNDSTTRVNIKISEPGRSYLNKLLVPFTNQSIEKDAHDVGNLFYDIVKVHLEITKVKVIGETELDSSFCACRSIESDQLDKANGMMMNYSILTSFISDHNLEGDGPPQVRVNEWDNAKGILKFDFCFPIKSNDSLPWSESIVYKKFNQQKVLKAEYRGNYITSDRAWYALLLYAQRNGYQINNTPIEYFHDNPTLGIDEANWKAEVYLPIE